MDKSKSLTYSEVSDGENESELNKLTTNASELPLQRNNMKRETTIEIDNPRNRLSSDETFHTTKKDSSFKKNLIDYVTEWSENTSLHGVRYLAERNRSIFEKLWWIVVFIISLYICFSLIAKTYHKWVNTPVIVSLATSPMPVYKIPFPAVTICPENKVRQSVFNYTHFSKIYEESKELMTPEEIKMYNDVLLVCGDNEFDVGDDYADKETLKTLSKVAPNFGDTFMTCKWADTNETCDHLFTKVLTDDGICHTFNMLHRDYIYKSQVEHSEGFLRHNPGDSEWTLEGGYNPHAMPITFPRRAMSAGLRSGLQILLISHKYDLDYLCNGPIQGYKVIFHSPEEIPRASSDYVRAPLNQEVIMSVKPNMMTTAPELRGYDAHKRECYFANERKLQFFKSYSQDNCELECLAKFMVENCNCVPYYIPHDNATKTCGAAKASCLRQAQAQFLYLRITKNILSQDESTPWSEIKDWDCDCLPACTTLTYDVESSQTDFNSEAVIKTYFGDIDDFPGMMFTGLAIRIKGNLFIPTERNELYGTSDFIASVGGLLGLFVGFSFISAVEAIYFATLRLLCNIKIYGARNFSGSDKNAVRGQMV